MAYKEYINFSKRTPLLYSLFTIPKNYLLPAKHKVSYMSGKLSMSVLYWIFSNHLHSYCIHCKRRGMQQCHVFLNCCHVEKMTLKEDRWTSHVTTWRPYDKKRRQWRPAKPWRDDLDKYWSNTIFQSTAQDRLTWRRHAEAITQPRDANSKLLVKTPHTTA